MKQLPNLATVKYPNGRTEHFKAISHPHYKPVILPVNDVILEGIVKSVDGLFNVYISKVRSRKRIIRDFKILQRRYRKTLLPPIRKWMKLQQETIQKGLPKMKGRKAGPMVERLCDWKHLEEQAVTIMKEPLLEVMNATRKRIVEGRVLKQEEIYDPLGPLAVDWATEHGATLVTEVTVETQAAINSYVATNLKEGVNARTIARELRPLVGLTEKDIWAVANYEEWLIVNRPEYTQAQINKATDVYARRKHRARTQMIARTETSSALNEGIVQGYGQMGVEKLERVEDPDAPDDDCQENNGRIYSIREASGVLPAHPACGGVFVMA